MSYNVEWKSGGTEGIPGKTTIVLPERTVDTTSTSLALTGKKTANYGEIQQENFIKLLENFASDTAPANPTIGQLWFSPVDKALYLCVETSTVEADTTVYFESGLIGWVRAWEATALGTISDEIALKADLDSPELTGTPTAPTAPIGTDNEQIANTGFVQYTVFDAVGGVAALNLTGHGATRQITLSEANNPIIIVSGAQTSDITLIFPYFISKVWTVINRTTGGSFRVFMKATLLDGVTLSATTAEVLRNNAQQFFTKEDEIGSAVTHVPGTSENVTGVVAVANGGTGATNAATARANLGVSSSTDTVNLTGDQTITGNKTFTGDLAKYATAGEARVQAVWDGVTEPSSTYVYNTSGSGGLGDSVYGPIIYTIKGVTPSVVIGGPSLTIKFRAGNIEVGSINSGGNLTTIGDSYFNGIRVGAGAYYLGTAPGSVAIGNGALTDNNEGVNNTAVGDGALSNNTNGFGNTSVGAFSLFANVVGSGNTAIGRGALANNTSINNTAIGVEALYSNTTGLQNTAVGFGSLVNNETGSNNIGVGIGSLHSNVSGDYNVAMGYNASYNNISGVNNTAVGFGALLGNSAFQYDNTSGFGAWANVTGSNQIQLGDNLTTTYVYGTVQNRSDIRDKADVRNTVLGLSFINSLRPVDYRWDLRDSYRTPMPTKKEVSPDATPEDILLLEEEYRRELSEWSELNQLNNMQRDGSKKRSRYHHGLIAQEVREVIESIGVDFGGFQDHSMSGGQDVLSIGYDELIAPLIKAVQELSARVVELEAKITE